MSRRSRAEWKALMAEHEETDMTVAAFAEAKGVKKESFRWWRKVFRREERQRIAMENDDRPLTARLVDRLAETPSSIADLAERTGSDVSTVSTEVRELARLGMVYEEIRKGCAPLWHLG